MTLPLEDRLARAAAGIDAARAKLATLELEHTRLAREYTKQQAATDAAAAQAATEQAAYDAKMVELDAETRRQHPQLYAHELKP